MVNITIYPGGALGAAEDHYDLCLYGAADIIFVSPHVTSGIFPLDDALTLPLEFPSSEIASVVYWELMEKYLKNTQYRDVKILFVYTTGLVQLHTIDRQVRTLEDFKGLRLSTDSSMKTKITKALGGTPVFMSPPDLPTSLDRGLIDGTFNEWEGAWTWKLHDVTNKRTGNLGLTTHLSVIMMNLDVWNSLPNEIQKIFNETSGYERSRSAGAVFDELESNYLEKIMNYDKQAENSGIYFLPEDEKTRWKEELSIVSKEWVKEQERKGLPATALLGDLRKLVKKYQEQKSAR
jgi:TRAP-type C4-dicarboxylate transport system substrate-binding protein